MKLNCKKLLALVLAAILALSLTGIAEEEISIESNVSPEDIVIDEDILTGDLFLDAEPTLNELNDLSLSDDIMEGLEGPTTDLSQDILTDIDVTNEEQDEDNASTITLGISETYKINTKGLGSNLTFKSSKPSIASVTTKGVIKGLKKGTASITVLSGTKEKAKYTVKVVAAPTKVTLPKKTITIGVKESVTMTPTIPKNSHTTFTWTSKNAAIASVNKSGKITGKKAGTTTITVKTHNGKKASIKVTVAKAPSKVTLNKTSATLMIGKKLQLKATLPSGSSSSVLTWKSSDTDVATVSKSGKVSAVGVGTAKITVTTYNKKTASCTITVESLSADKTYVSIDAGKTATVEITSLAEGDLYWDVDDSSVATCSWDDDWYGNTTYLYIKGVDEGSTTVSVENEDTGEVVYIDVEVTGHQSGYTGEIFGAYGMDYDDFSSILDDPLMYSSHENGSYYYSNSYMLQIVTATGQQGHNSRPARDTIAGQKLS